MNKYFSTHYAYINNIVPESENSILKWYNSLLEIYEREFMPYIGSLENKKILELGCGIGGLLYFVKNRGIDDILGIDISEEQLEVCRKYVTGKVIQSDAIEFLEKSNTQYDLIVLFDLIEHFPKQKIPLRIKTIFKQLNPGGVTIVRTPNMGSPFGLYSRYIDFTHEVGFTAESLRQIFKQEEFQSVKVYNTYIGRRRKFILELINKILGKIYNTKLSGVVTRDLILVAIK